MAVDLDICGAGGKRMTSGEYNGRHLRVESLDQYLASRAPSLLRIDGSPTVYLWIDPLAPTLALRAPASRKALPDVSAYQFISASQIHWNDANWFELRIDGHCARDGYPILCAIADALQLEGLDFNQAVARSIDALREVLARVARLSVEEEVGLYGELVVLEHLVTRMSALEAVASWRGPLGEEHDFDVLGNDIEVKSTIAEQRIHWIADDRQLEPSLGRPLWLLSVQLTRAGMDGRTLLELRERLSLLLQEHPEACELFDRKLSELHWDDGALALNPTRFRLRNRPVVFAVDNSFPTITRSRLNDAGLDLARIVKIKYAIDLSDLQQATDLPTFLLDIGAQR